MGWRRLRLACIPFSCMSRAIRMPRTAPALLLEFGVNAGTARDPTARDKDLLDVGGETSIFSFALTHWALAPCVIPTLRDSKHSAHGHDGKLLLVVFDTLLFHRFPVKRCSPLFFVCHDPAELSLAHASVGDFLLQVRFDARYQG